MQDELEVEEQELFTALLFVALLSCLFSFWGRPNNTNECHEWTIGVSGSISVQIHVFAAERLISSGLLVK